MATERLSEEVTFKSDCGMGWCQACEELGKGGVPGRRKSCAETLGWEELIILLKNREGSGAWRAGCRGGGCQGRAGEWSRQSSWSSFELGKDPDFIPTLQQRKMRVFSPCHFSPENGLYRRSGH